MHFRSPDAQHTAGAPPPQRTLHLVQKNYPSCRLAVAAEQLANKSFKHILRHVTWSCGPVPDGATCPRVAKREDAQGLELGTWQPHLCPSGVRVPRLQPGHLGTQPSSCFHLSVGVSAPCSPNAEEECFQGNVFLCQQVCVRVNIKTSTVARLQRFC